MRKKHRGPYIGKNPGERWTFADIMPKELIELAKKLPSTTPAIQQISTETQNTMVSTMTQEEEQKVIETKGVKTTLEEPWRYFENVELITIQEARDIARKNKFILTLWYKGKKLLGYLKDAKNIPRDQRIFKIEKGDWLKFPDDMLRFCDGERFIHYDEHGEEELSASV